MFGRKEKKILKDLLSVLGLDKDMFPISPTPCCSQKIENICSAIEYNLKRFEKTEKLFYALLSHLGLTIQTECNEQLPKIVKVKRVKK